LPREVREVRFKLDRDKILIFDGAMGTMLQSRGLKVGEIPELLTITSPEVIESIHSEYLQAGADVVLTNTFGANRYKAEKAGCTLESMVKAAVESARRAVESCGHGYVALDIGPCGRIMEPTGDLPFEEACEVFAEIVRIGAPDADLIVIETFTDLYEIKAALLAAKENSDLPVFTTMSFEESGNTFFGTTVESMVLTLEGLGADALGVNCSLGPKQLVPIVERILSYSKIPVMIQPNAGLPVTENGRSRYDVTPEEFIDYMKQFAEGGASILGGCCGTNPEYISMLSKMASEIKPAVRDVKRGTAICSPSKTVSFGGDTVVIGERLNPTGKKKMQAALREHNIDYLLREAVNQQEQGADVLDLNVGLPDIDEISMLSEAVKEVQGIVDLPLQLDSSNAKALDAAARVYNGKPLINSVNGTKESLESVLPVVKKYGAAVLGLTLDDDGVPDTAEKRLEIARKIVRSAESYGIAREDVLIDCLTMTVSAQQDQAVETLRALRMVKDELGVKTVLGVSNVSFGLPKRPLINRTMLAMALQNGLDAPIMNPGAADMAETVAAYRVLTSRDPGAERFIEKFSGQTEIKAEVKAAEAPSLAKAISRGLKRESEEAVKALLAEKDALDIIENGVVPALDEVGKDYESQKIFLPQLIKSAEAAKAAFEVLRTVMAAEGGSTRGGRTKVIVATVHGDIHDIGKNIVKVIMENYNFNVIDLGRDVPPEKVVEAVKEHGVKIVGLSALMTTTVESMRKTIELLREHCPGTTVIVGGAVLTSALSEFVGADFYAKDAMESVRIAERVEI
jgi:5-methyltetrahydrofolate--homocysteine methyltransferase